MALGLGEREVRPLTADEVMRMVELGILDEDEPVELLHGVLTRVSAKGPDHEVVKMRLNRWLAPGFVADQYDVRVEGCLIVPDRTSLPEPDILVTEPCAEIAHPDTALLVIEVAVSSLRTDTGIKPALYAAAGAPEYWVVDVEARRVNVLRDPRPDGYAAETVAGVSEVIEPRCLDVDPLDLAGLFAGL